MSQELHGDPDRPKHVKFESVNEDGICMECINKFPLSLLQHGNSSCPEWRNTVPFCKMVLPKNWAALCRSIIYFRICHIIPSMDAIDERLKASSDPLTF